MCSVAHMIAGCTDVDLRQAQGRVSERRLHDIDRFTAPHQMHRDRVPEGTRRRSTRDRTPARANHRRTRSSSAAGVSGRCVAAQPDRIVAPRPSAPALMPLATQVCTAVTTSGGSGQSRTAPPSPMTRTYRSSTSRIRSPDLPCETAIARALARLRSTGARSCDGLFRRIGRRVPGRRR